MARVIRSITTDPRYPEFCARYRHNYRLAALELFGKEPTWQQDEILESVQEEGSKTTVTSGHGTGKSDMTSIIIMTFIMTTPGGRGILMANKISQVQTGVFKYVKENWKRACQRAPWLQNYFVMTDTTFYERTGKGTWTTVAKSCRRGNEEALAGEHAEHMLIVVDEASGVSDKAFGVVTGAMTQKDNRILLLSQPTRPSGYFYDTHHKLARTSQNPNGEYNAICLNSEESPLVTTEFIKMKLAEYGGRDSMEYAIKVLGRFPRKTDGFLLGLDDIQRAQRRKVHLAKGWGWMALCDVGNGRDKSVILICQVSGERQHRRVVGRKMLEMSGECDPVTFGRRINAECTHDKYPNITIAVDADGVGSSTCKILEEAGHNVVRIRWGKPMHARQDKERFINKRAYACIMAAEAVKSGRMRPTADFVVAEQGSRIPFSMNEYGQYVIMKKPQMRAQLNIKSPDHWDVYCFAWLVDYVPANEDIDYDRAAGRANALAHLNDYDGEVRQHAEGGG
ncbi:TPA: terminase [Citrobacter freundii]|nr:terminase [Citrobacter freundii]HAT3963912.1 terminase [Citrobacter freundii]